jgi:hypothetical protein
MHAAEAAAQRIAALVTEAEAAVRRISLHAEMTFSHLQNASSAVHLIGQQAAQALEALADANFISIYLSPSMYFSFRFYKRCLLFFLLSFS